MPERPASESCNDGERVTGGSDSDIDDDDDSNDDRAEDDDESVEQPGADPEDGTQHCRRQRVTRGSADQGQQPQEVELGELFEKLRLTITDLGPDDRLGGDNDIELFSKEFNTAKRAWNVYTSTTESQIEALGNTVRFAFTVVSATGGTGPKNTECNFLDAAEFCVGVLTTAREPIGVK